MRVASLALRLVLEPLLLAALAVTGARAADGVAGLLLAVGLPVAAALAWGAFVAPKAPRRLADPARLALEAVLFASAVAGLAATGLPLAAAALGAGFGISTGLLLALDQRGEA